MIKHIVMWTFKDEALGRDKAGNVAEVKRQLDALPDIVPGMGLFEVVPAQPGLEASYDLCLYSEFADLESLRAYVRHPQHVAVGALINSVRLTRVAFDYDPDRIRV